MIYILFLLFYIYCSAFWAPCGYYAIENKFIILFIISIYHPTFTSLHNSPHLYISAFITLTSHLCIHNLTCTSLCSLVITPYSGLLNLYRSVSPSGFLRGLPNPLPQGLYSSWSSWNINYSCIIWDENKD